MEEPVNEDYKKKVINAIAARVATELHAERRQVVLRWLEREIRAAATRQEPLDAVRKRYNDLLCQAGKSEQPNIVTVGSEKVLLDEDDAIALGAEFDTVVARTKSGCFIATACYGTYDHPSVQKFRWFRDNRLNCHSWGKHLVDTYNRLSPPVAAFLRNRPVVAAVVRRYLLAPILYIVVSAQKGSRL